ncbi:MAG TPA: DUF2085 domain-containing protein [Anaerolineales bacterium]|nr:DUF2085 domain-containing protein [Anaerolineales bacterium]
MNIASRPARARTSVQVASILSRYWIVVFGLIFGILNGMPLLAPVFMKLGWTTPAKVIYFIYSFLCHQLPQRSFFMFGSQTMYPLNEIQAVWQDTLNPVILRQFIGNAQMGWKVAWSDRMVSMYASLLVFGLLWWPVRGKIRPLRWWWLILFLLPMALDGSSHLVSDLWGLGGGFRYTNEWLAELTNGAFPENFYQGDGSGSFNSWMRLLTGVLFGAGVVWFSFPYLQIYFSEQTRMIERKVAHIRYQVEVEK